MLLLVLMSLVSLHFHSCVSFTMYIDCVSQITIKTAEDALDLINAVRTEGYIFALNRVYDVGLELREDGEKFVHLFIDVLETKCHVISRSKWKSCEIKGIGDVPVFGTCKATIPFLVSKDIHEFNCTIQEVPSAAVIDVCPDCPTKENLDDPIVVETAKVALQKFNKESSLSNYFVLKNVTAASMQWIVGPAYFVEFIVEETDCNKTSPEIDFSQCRPKNGTSTKGFCTGSHVTHDDLEITTSKKFSWISGTHTSIEDVKKKISTEVSCTIYPHTAREEFQSTKLPSGTVLVLPPPPNPMPARIPAYGRKCPGTRKHKLGLDAVNL